MTLGAAPDLHVATDSLEIHIEVVGTGEPVILIHGLGLTGALWNRVRDALGPGYQLILIDLRGAGGTRELRREDLSLERWADDLADLLQTLRIERPVLVGHSLGASVALKFALSHPADVRALVLIGAEADLSNLAPRMLASAERIEQIGMEAWVEEYWSKNPPFSDESLARDPSMLVDYRELLLNNDPSDYVRQCRAIATAESLSDRLGDVTQPALVVIGSNDDRTLPEHGRELAGNLADAQVVELPDVGHTLPLEAPEATAAAVRSFLEQATGRVQKAAVLRADTTPRNAREGPFGHIDVRWVVGPDEGATLIAFGQSTYPLGVTHENHYHPHAEEIVMVISGRGTQVVGDEALDLGPGDICFIPANTPHRISGASEDEDCVILWAFGGAASVEQAGYVPLPD